MFSLESKLSTAFLAVASGALAIAIALVGLTGCSPRRQTGGPLLQYLGEDIRLLGYSSIAFGVFALMVLVGSASRSFGSIRACIAYTSGWLVAGSILYFSILYLDLCMYPESLVEHWRDGPRGDGRPEREQMWIGELDFDGETLSGRLVVRP